MRILRLLIFGTPFFCLTAVADPIKLISTSPSLWAVNVNPVAQKTISLRFDQRLRSRLTDWIGLDVLSPPSDLQTKFSADGMSCSIDVQLQPGKVYICGLNERGLPGVGFQNEKGFALPPTYLVFQTAGTPGPNDVPARIVRSNPPNAMQSVDSTRTVSITVTFDKPMNPKKHGLHFYENNQSVDISKLPFSYSADGMTFILPCRLKPATQYRLELNSTKDIGFARTTRVPLWPAVISFTTR
jgi:hypothetical protein